MGDNQVHNLTKPDIVIQCYGRHQLELFPLLEWECLKAVIYRFKGRVSLNRKAKIDMIMNALTDEWAPAEQVALAGTLPFHSVTKMMYSLALEGKIESKEDCWVDHRMRNRKRHLYRKNQDIQGSMDVLMRAFGMVSAEMPRPKVGMK